MELSISSTLYRRLCIDKLPVCSVNSFSLCERLAKIYLFSLSELSRKVASNYADGVYMVNDDLPSARLLSQSLMRGKLFYVILM